MAHVARRTSIAVLSITSIACLIGPAGAQDVCGDVQAVQKISETVGGLPLPLHGWGDAVATLGDLDGDGLLEVAVGEPLYFLHGAVWILSLNADGTVAAGHRIAEGEAGFTGDLDFSDWFGAAVTSLGDLDGNGVPDLAVGARGDDDNGEDVGAVWVLFLTTEGQVASHSKISDLGPGQVLGLDTGDAFGSHVADLGDLDGDGRSELAVGSWNDELAGAGTGTVYLFFMQADGTWSSNTRITEGVGGFAGSLDLHDHFASVAALGDLDGDGIPDLAVGAPSDDDGGPYQQFQGSGAVWLLMLNADGSVKSHVKISDTEGGFTGPLGANHRFGSSVVALGDLDGDGVGDLAVGAIYDEAGAVWVLFMNADGTVRAHTRISDGSGGMPGDLLDSADAFGACAASLGDLDGDGTVDLIVGAPTDDDGDEDLGAVWVLFLQDGPVPWSNLGHALAGTSGEPALWGVGALAGNDPFSLHLVEARPNVLAGLFLGFSTLFAPCEGGIFVPAPDELFLVGTDAAGSFSAGAVWPPGLPAGTEVFFQFWIVDPQGPFGLAASNGLALSTP